MLLGGPVARLLRGVVVRPLPVALRGGRLHAVTYVNDEEPLPGGESKRLESIGNPQRALWKSSCWELARHAHTAVTLHTMLNARLPELADPKTTTGFRHVHQLDFATSGVLCIALNKRAAGAAGKLFQARAVDKCYLALVDGHTSFDHTRVEAGIGEDASDARGFLMALEGAPGCTAASAATTDVYTVARGALADGRRVSKLLLKPASGRRHQLRLHCVALGHPIVGDVAYSGDHAAPRMCLHAYCLSLPLKAGAACVASADPFPAAGVTRRKSRDDDADDDFDRSMIRVVAAADLELGRLLRELRGGEAPRGDVLISVREGRHRN